MCQQMYLIQQLYEFLINIKTCRNKRCHLGKMMAEHLVKCFQNSKRTCIFSHCSIKWLSLYSKLSNLSNLSWAYKHMKYNIRILFGTRHLNHWVLSYDQIPKLLYYVNETIRLPIFKTESIVFVLVHKVTFSKHSNNLIVRR
jgi:hypothetical protein